MVIIDLTKPAPVAPRYPLKRRKSIPAEVRRRVYEKFSGRCAYCGSELSGRWCVDHVHAHHRGGSDSINNLMPACHPCNLFKMTFSIEGFRREIEQQVERARRSSVNYRTAERFGLIAQVKSAVTFYFEQATRQEGAE